MAKSITFLCIWVRLMKPCISIFFGQTELSSLLGWCLSYIWPQFEVWLSQAFLIQNDFFQSWVHFVANNWWKPNKFYYICYRYPHWVLFFCINTITHRQRNHIFTDKQRNTVRSNKFMFNSAWAEYLQPVTRAGFMQQINSSFTSAN